MGWLAHGEPANTRRVLGKKGRAQRRVTFVKAKLLRGEEWHDVQIGNISASGLMLRLADPPAVGERVEVRHRGWHMTGEVVWRERSRVGVRADRDFDPREVLRPSDLGQKESALLHKAPSNSIWHWLRRR